MKAPTRAIIAVLVATGVGLVAGVPAYLMYANAAPEQPQAARVELVDPPSAPPAATVAPTKRASKAKASPRTRARAARRTYSSGWRSLPLGIDPRQGEGKGLGFRWPVGDGPEDITSPYGPRGEGFHHGADIGCWEGQAIGASYAGRVVWAGEARVYGHTVLVDHGRTYQTLYAHLSRIDVQLGEVVRRGEAIGLCGSTGRSTGPHLHFELRYGGYVWDPLVFLP